MFVYLPIPHSIFYEFDFLGKIASLISLYLTQCWPSIQVPISVSLSFFNGAGKSFFEYSFSFGAKSPQLILAPAVDLCFTFPSLFAFILRANFLAVLLMGWFFGQGLHKIRATYTPNPTHIHSSSTFVIIHHKSSFFCVHF